MHKSGFTALPGTCGKQVQLIIANGTSLIVSGFLRSTQARCHWIYKLLSPFICRFHFKEYMARNKPVGNKAGPWWKAKEEAGSANVPMTVEPGQWSVHEDHRPESQRACDITGCVTRPALRPVSSRELSPPEREGKDKLEDEEEVGSPRYGLRLMTRQRESLGKKGVVTDSSPNLPAANLFTGKILLPAPLLILRLHR